jgi:hypothetical protein
MEQGMLAQWRAENAALAAAKVAATRERLRDDKAMYAAMRESEAEGRDAAAGAQRALLQTAERQRAESAMGDRAANLRWAREQSAAGEAARYRAAVARAGSVARSREVAERLPTLHAVSIARSRHLAKEHTIAAGAAALPRPGTSWRLL